MVLGRCRSITSRRDKGKPFCMPVEDTEYGSSPRKWLTTTVLNRKQIP